MSTLAFPQTPQQRRAFGKLLSTEIKLTMRRPRGLIVSLGMPFLLLVIFGSIPATTRPTAALGGISFFDTYVPTLLLFVLTAVALVVLPQQLATYRQQGVLRRMSTTPVPPLWLLAAQLTVNLGMAALGIALLLGAGAGAFGLTLPSSVGGYLVFLLALVLTAAATLGLGLCVAAVVSSPQVAAAISGVMFYVLAFFSGLWVPLQDDPLTRRHHDLQDPADRRRVHRSARRVQRALPGRRAAARARGLGRWVLSARRARVPLGVTRSKIDERRGRGPRGLRPGDHSRPWRPRHDVRAETQRRDCTSAAAVSKG